MRIISYNVNGTVQRFRKDLSLGCSKQILMSFVQEIKATPEQIPLLISWLPIITGFLQPRKDI
jgi:exonuclease III